MEHVYAVLGAGMQGTAAAFDLARHGEAREVRILDREEGLAAAAAARVNRLVGREVALPGVVDAASPEDVARMLEGAGGVLSAVPYGLNLGVARAALEAGACMCDLGGNTDVVREILRLDARARERGVSLLPDCGLAPGLGNQLAALGLELLPQARHVHIRCGGLPRRPRPPLDYMLVFSIGGLTNEYTGFGEFLREGRKVRVPAFTEVEEISFQGLPGRLEAFVTSGGTSTCAETFAGRLTTFDYKTVRYPGHFEKFRVLIDLGLLDLEPVDLGGTKVVPRDLFHACAAPRLTFPGEEDLVLLRVDVLEEDRSSGLRFELTAGRDATTGFSAMECCTAFPAAATLHFQVRGEAEPGARGPERGVPPQRLLEAVRKRGLAVRRETI